MSRRINNNFFIPINSLDHFPSLSSTTSNKKKRPIIDRRRTEEENRLKNDKVISHGVRHSLKKQSLSEWLGLKNNNEKSEHPTSVEKKNGEKNNVLEADSDSDCKSDLDEDYYRYMPDPIPEEDLLNNSVNVGNSKIGEREDVESTASLPKETLNGSSSSRFISQNESSKKKKKQKKKDNKPTSNVLNVNEFQSVVPQNLSRLKADILSGELQQEIRREMQKLMLQEEIEQRLNARQKIMRTKYIWESSVEQEIAKDASKSNSQNGNQKKKEKSQNTSPENQTKNKIKQKDPKGKVENISEITIQNGMNDEENDLYRPAPNGFYASKKTDGFVNSKSKRGFNQSLSKVDKGKRFSILNTTLVITTCNDSKSASSGLISQKKTSKKKEKKKKDKKTTDNILNEDEFQSVVQETVDQAEVDFICCILHREISVEMRSLNLQEEINQRLNIPQQVVQAKNPLKKSSNNSIKRNKQKKGCKKKSSKVSKFTTKNKNRKNKSRKQKEFPNRVSKREFNQRLSKLAKDIDTHNMLEVLDIFADEELELCETKTKLCEKKKWTRRKNFKKIRIKNKNSFFIDDMDQ